MLEFFSYMLNFQGIMAGPLVFYQDYINFVEGRYLLRMSSIAMVRLLFFVKVSVFLEPILSKFLRVDPESTRKLAHHYFTI